MTYSNPIEALEDGSLLTDAETRCDQNDAALGYLRETLGHAGLCGVIEVEVLRIEQELRLTTDVAGQIRYVRCRRQDSGVRFNRGQRCAMFVLWVTMVGRDQEKLGQLLAA